uniref:TonB C-terminal domain-containing protein n=1 Tax=Solibacter usitatus (strain Ellin6076) TaxID=234267 RepID=Q01RK2_SOLUE
MPSAFGEDLPTLITFVAPVYPQSAKDQRISGKTEHASRSIATGFVTEATTIIAHRVFEDYVLEALKQWRFKPSGHEYTLEVTCIFELTEGKCEGLRPITPGTHVSAELPTIIHISSDMACIIDC